MSKNIFIQKLVKLLYNAPTIKSLILYGSYARKGNNPNSDIDLAIWVNDEFDSKEILKQLKTLENKKDVLSALDIKIKNRFIIYFYDKPKIEIVYVKNLENLNNYYLASKIPKQLVRQTIIFDKSNEVESKILNWYDKDTFSKEKNDVVKNLVYKFIYAFENASYYHSISDSFRFYFFYNSALTSLIQLEYLSKGGWETYYFPKYVFFMKGIDQKYYNDMLIPKLDLNYANTYKRNLLEKFYNLLKNLNLINLGEIKNILEIIYFKHFLWNFRDLAKYNSKIKPGIIFRSATLAEHSKHFPDETLQILKNNKIKVIIDIRSEKEKEEKPYNQTFIKHFEYKCIPYNQDKIPDDILSKINPSGKLSGMQVLYSYIALYQCENLKAIFSEIAKHKSGILVHCFGGKDRTGFISLVLGLLVSSDYKELLNDYLASANGVTKEMFNFYYDLIKQFGNIEKYLTYCKIPKHLYSQVRKIIKK